MRDMRVNDGRVGFLNRAVAAVVAVLLILIVLYKKRNAHKF